jgi:glycosyltransferase involved in cell wall biosynthesis
MSKIRVCNITFDWYPFDPLVRRLAEAAADGGNSVDVICLRQSHEMGHEVYNGVHVYRVPMNRGFGQPLLATIMNWCWFSLLAALYVTRLHLKNSYHVIHVHNIPDFLVFSALIPRLLGAKVILHVQDVCPELMAAKARGRKRKIISRLATWQERISTAFAHHVITVGWPFEQLLLGRGVSQEKITIILNSADPKLFPPSRRCLAASDAPEQEQPFIVMYHGTLAERNGLDVAIRALSLALQTVPLLRLDIQGRGEHLPFLKQLAEELGVSNHVVFTAPCPTEQVVDFVVHGDIGIIPYQSDGFMDLVLPTKAYEFAWMNRPMIASDTPAIRSMFRPGSITFCNPQEPESFANAIIDLFQNPEKRARMVMSADEDYEPYRWEYMATRYLQLLTFLCYKRKQKREAPSYSEPETMRAMHKKHARYRIDSVQGGEDA